MARSAARERATGEAPGGIEWRLLASGRRAFFGGRAGLALAGSGGVGFLDLRGTGGVRSLFSGSAGAASDDDVFDDDGWSGATWLRGAK